MKIVFFLWDIYNEEQEKVNFIVEDYEVLFMQIINSIICIVVLFSIVHFAICLFFVLGKGLQEEFDMPIYVHCYIIWYCMC